jgi:hypothetical protein
MVVAKMMSYIKVRTFWLSSRGNRPPASAYGRAPLRWELNLLIVIAAIVAAYMSNAGLKKPNKGQDYVTVLYVF